MRVTHGLLTSRGGQIPIRLLRVMRLEVMEGITVKTSLSIVAAAAILLGVAAPAAADRPVLAAEDFEWTYSIENPCSGGEIVVTEIGDVSEHVHRNNVVSQPDITVDADSGFEGFAVDIGVGAAGGEVANHQVMLFDATTGETVRIMLRGLLDADTGEWIIGGDFEVTCLSS